MSTSFVADLAELSKSSASRPFDCIVVGGGTAGLVTASTLVEAMPDAKVLILEAGSVPFLTHVTNTELRFSRTLTRKLRNQTAYSPKLPDGRKFGTNYGCVGGRGLFWNGAAPRFREHDFEGWPLAYQDVAEYYSWAEREFRVTKGLGGSKLATRMIEMLREGGFGAEPGPFAVDTALTNGVLGAGVASGLGVLFRRSGDALGSGQLQIASGSLVLAILHSESEARGVLVSSVEGTHHEILSRCVVLAAGGIESVRLAALSNIPDKSGKIGIGIQEHLFYDCWFQGESLYDKELAETAVVYVPSSCQGSEQWELHAPGRRLFSLDDGTEWVPSNEAPYQIMCRAFCATEKRDENYVESEEGPRGSAIIHFDYSERDGDSMRRIAERAAAIKSSLGLVEVGGTPVDSIERFRAPGSSYHEAGGLDMGVDPRRSVTDPDGCFHQLGNLVSVDAASFPLIGATNPHLTIMAIARRKASSLVGKLR